jgi:hypothetical protein
MRFQLVGADICKEALISLKDIKNQCAMVFIGAIVPSSK